jgi:geranylgeranyl reductase family protein
MSSPNVLIAGAGPAGSIAALVLARAGVRVTVIDRAQFPRDKLCGDTVNPGAMAILRRLGVAHVADDGLAVHGMVVTGESGVRCQGRYADGLVGRALRRHQLDERLLRAATDAGATIEERTLVREPIVENGRVRGVVVSGPDGHARSLDARMVIAADGASSRLARALQLSRHSARPRRWAVGAYFEGVDAGTPGPPVGEMHVRSDRYVGVAPLSNDVTNVCVVTADRAALRDPARLVCETLRRDAILAPRFSSARQVTPPVCLGPLAVDNVACGMPGLLLAGDAAGFIDPMTGDGLRFAFRGGELAASAALMALEQGHDNVHEWLARARRREFAPKWRFNRTLRALVGSAAAVGVAARVATIAPSVIEQVVRYAGDCRVGTSA